MIENGVVVQRQPNNAPGFVELPDHVVCGYLFDGEEFFPPALPPLSPDDVVAERGRRLAAGFDYEFGDARGGHRIGTTPEDLIGWKEVTDFANALVALGDTTTQIAIATDTGPTQVTALEWQQILVAAAAFRQPIWLASFALQEMEPIPIDYATNESYWS